MDIRRLPITAASMVAVLLLAGCQPGGPQSKTVTREVINGVDVIHSETRQHDGNVSLSCIASRSGQCHYRVRGLDDCAVVAAERAQCTTSGELQVGLLPGTSWTLAAGGKVTVCVSDNPDKACAAK